MHVPVSPPLLGFLPGCGCLLTSVLSSPIKHTQLISSHSPFRDLLEKLAAITVPEQTHRQVTYFGGGGHVDNMETVVGDLMATELRLGLPGTAGDSQPPQMRAPSTPRGKKRTCTTDAVTEDAAAAAAAAAEEAASNNRDVEAAPPAAKAPVVGWPPVRSYRKSCFVQQAATTNTKQQLAANKEEAAAPSGGNTTAASAATTAGAAAAAGGSFVKVSMDGAPYLRKVDLRMYKGYRELREALEAMFVSSNNSGGANLSEFAVTYQDKDGDLMLVGDVPFEMFTGTCKKLRIMKRSEATGLGGSARQ